MRRKIYEKYTNPIFLDHTAESKAKTRILLNSVYYFRF